jgi:sugar phosphate permease
MLGRIKLMVIPMQYNALPGRTGGTIHYFHESCALNGYLEGGIISNLIIKKYHLLPNILIFTILCVPMFSFNLKKFLPCILFVISYFFVFIPYLLFIMFLTKLGI